MDRFRHLAQIFVSICSAALLLGASHAAHAGGFSDAFKNFVLGSEANAGTLSAVQLPAASLSRTCMQCHNGSTGPRINMKHVGAPMQFRGVSIDHPVGMDYGQYAAKRPESYVMPTRMDARILLEDGKVTCVSCHQTESEPVAQSGVAQTRTSSQLCNVGAGYTTGHNRTRLCVGCHSM